MKGSGPILDPLLRGCSSEPAALRLSLARCRSLYTKRVIKLGKKKKCKNLPGEAGKWLKNIYNCFQIRRFSPSLLLYSLQEVQCSWVRLSPSEPFWGKPCGAGGNPLLCGLSGRQGSPGWISEHPLGLVVCCSSWTPAGGGAVML